MFNLEGRKKSKYRFGFRGFSSDPPPIWLKTNFFKVSLSRVYKEHQRSISSAIVLNMLHFMNIFSRVGNICFVYSFNFCILFFPFYFFLLFGFLDFLLLFFGFFRFFGLFKLFFNLCGLCGLFGLFVLSCLAWEEHEGNLCILKNRVNF